MTAGLPVLEGAAPELLGLPVSKTGSLSDKREYCQ